MPGLVLLLTAGASQALPDDQGGGEGGKPPQGEERPKQEPVSVELAEETTRLFLVKLDADGLHKWNTEIKPVQDVISRMNAAQLEQVIRTLARSGRDITDEEMSWDDFPLTVLAGLDPMAAVNLYSELWPPGGPHGPKLWPMLEIAAEKEPRAVAAWVPGQAGRGEEALLRIRTFVLEGAMERDVKLGFSLIHQVGATDYRQMGRNLAPCAGSSGKKLSPGTFLAGMREFATTLPPEDGAALREGAIEGIANQVGSNGESGIEGELARWPLAEEELSAVLESMISRYRPDALVTWLAGPSRSPAAQAARRLFLEKAHPVTPDQAERVRAALE